MGNLSDKLIRQSFDGLIKTNDEDPISATPKRLQDGVGNDLPIEVGLSGMVYYGTQDFTNATIVGGGAAGTSGSSGTSGVDGTSGSSGTSGGGGGGSSIDTNNLATGFKLPSSNLAYRMTYSTPSFSTTSLSQSAGTLYVGAISMEPGQTIDEIALWVQTASASGSMVLGLYKATTDVNGYITIGDLEVQFGSVSTSTTGKKSITSIGHTLGATQGGIYFYAYVLDEVASIAAANHSGGIVTHPTYVDNISGTNIINKMGSYSTSQAYGDLPTDVSGKSWTGIYRYPMIGFA